MLMSFIVLTSGKEHGTSKKTYFIIMQKISPS